MSMHQLAFEAKQLCRQEHSGVLSTHSTSVPGYPFGSVVPFYLTAQGDAIIYISDIALHTRNIKANPKVSLTIYDAGQDDSQANGRVTLLGDASLCDDQQAVAETYYQLFPQSRAYQKTHDFNFYVIKAERVRYIGGFGKIHWINKEFWQVESQPWQEQPESMISHMNKDHQEAMQAILLAHHQVSPMTVTMLTVFPEGAHYQGDDNAVYYVPFTELCNDPTAIRKALVALTQQARSFLAQPTHA